MFTITNKIRTIIALGAVGAAVASSGVASAAIPVHRPGTGTVTRVVAPPTIVADEAIDPNKVGSAGIAGYDDAACEQLANESNAAMKGANAAAGDGDTATANDLYGIAQDKDAELEDNCLVID
jgi:hypothetical protein